MDKEKIASEAKQIMDDFLHVIEDMDIKETTHTVERKKQYRDAPHLNKPSETFRNTFFANAKKHDSSYILTEKKKW